MRKYICVGSNVSEPSLRARRRGICSLKLIIFLAFSLLFAAQVAGQSLGGSGGGATVYKVAVLPVSTNSPENLNYLRDGLLDMLSSRVELSGRVAVLEKGAVKKALSRQSGEMNGETARGFGRELGADFVVFGSLTKLGNSASLDLKIVEVGKEGPGSSVSANAPKLEDIIARVDDLARRIDEAILGHSLRPQPAEKVAVKTPEAPKDTGGFPTIPAPSGGMKTGRMASSGEFWQSQAFPFPIVGMAVGDVDGDGRNEVVLIGEKALYVYRWDEGFKLLWKKEGARLDQYLAVDVADVDKDGVPEIFVTAMAGQRLSSFAVAFKEGNFRMVSSGLDWFLRAVEWEGKGTVLLGQEKAYGGAFERAVYEMGWDGKKYKPLKKAAIPKVYSIYGFVPFPHDGKVDFFFLDDNFRARLVNEKGKVVWSSSDDYGSDRAFISRPQAESRDPRKDPDEFAYINVRVIRRGSDIVIIRNLSATGALFTKTRVYTKGEVQILNWTGAVFMPGWRSQEIAGYLADLQMDDVDGKSGKELLVAVILPAESVLTGRKDSALMISRMPELQ